MSTEEFNLDERMNQPVSALTQGSKLKEKKKQNGKGKGKEKAKVLVHRFKNALEGVAKQSSNANLSKKRPAEAVEGASKNVTKRRKWSNDVTLQFRDGRFVVLVLPEALQKTMTEENFVNNCQKSQMTRDGVRYGKISKRVWFLRYRTPEEASLMVGREITFSEEIGIEDKLTLKFISFYQYDSRFFYTMRVGPYDDPEIQALLETKFPGEKYWMGGKKIREFLSGQRLLIFENPQDKDSFELGAESSYLIRFKKLKGSENCTFCSKSHVQGTSGCQLIVPCESSNDLKYRLPHRP